MDDEYALALNDLYGSVTEPGRIDAFTRRLMRLTRSHIAAVHLMDFRDHQASIPQVYGIKLSDIAPYSEVMNGENIWMERQQHLMLPGYVADCDRFVDQKELKRTRFWADGLRHFDVSHSTGIVLARDAQLAGSLSLSRSEQSGPYSPSELDLLRALAPHYLNVVQLQQRLKIAEQFAEALDAGIDGVPVWLLDPGGRVLRMNTAAAAVLRQDGWILIDHGVLAPRQHRAEYLSAFSAVASGAVASQSVHWRHVDASIVLSLRRLTTAAHGPATLALSLHERLPDRTDREQEFAKRHGLTRAERRLALLFHQRLDLAQVAAELRISIGNARTTLKQVMAKTGAHSQAALALLIEREIRD